MANFKADAFLVAGKTGATAASAYVGATASGPPTTGTFNTGDWIVDQAGTKWVCTAGGSPGTRTPTDRRSPHLVVAASNSSATWKKKADYICTGSGDETQINSALTAIATAGGCVELSEGTFTIANPIAVTANSFQLRGQGSSATFVTRSANVNMFTVTGTHIAHVEFGAVSNIWFGDASRSSSRTASALKFSYCDHIQVRDVVVDAIYGMAVEGNEFWDSDFWGCFFLDCGGQAGTGVPVINLYDSVSDNSNNIRFWGCTCESYREGGLFVQTTQAGNISGNRSNIVKWIGGKFESGFVRGPAVYFNTADYCSVLNTIVAPSGFDTGFSTAQPAIKVLNGLGHFIHDNQFLGSAPTRCFLQLDSSTGVRAYTNSGTADGTGPTVAYIEFVSTSSNNFDLDIPRLTLDFDANATPTITSGASKVDMSSLINFPDTGWVAISSFSNSWVNRGNAGDSPAAYRVQGNKLSLRGMIASGTLNTTAFTVPAPFRPPYTTYRSTVSNHAFGEVQMDTGGNVNPRTGSNTWFMLDGAKAIELN